MRDLERAHNLVASSSTPGPLQRATGVTNGSASAVYGWLANSPLVSQTTFRSSAFRKELLAQMTGKGAGIMEPNCGRPTNFMLKNWVRRNCDAGIGERLIWCHGPDKERELYGVPEWFNKIKGTGIGIVPNFILGK